jgi:hypothetical protein
VYRYFDTGVSPVSFYICVPIKKVSDNLPKINKGLASAPASPLQNTPGYRLLFRTCDAMHNTIS